jgi:hypothetical protein
MSPEYVYELRVTNNHLVKRAASVSADIGSAKISSTDTVRALCDSQMAARTRREDHHWNLISASYSLYKRSRKNLCATCAALR